MGGGGMKDELMKHRGCFSSFQFNNSVMSDSLQPHGLQHTRLPCPSPTPGACSNSCPLSWWYHPTILSSVVPFSSQLQSFPASGSFQMSQFFTSGGQSIGVSASASVLPMNIQDWFPLGCLGQIKHSAIHHNDGNAIICLSKLIECTTQRVNPNINYGFVVTDVSIQIRGSSQPRDRTQVSCITGRCFAIWTTREAQRFIRCSKSFTLVGDVDNGEAMESGDRGYGKSLCLPHPPPPERKIYEMHVRYWWRLCIQKMKCWNFPGGPVVKNDLSVQGTWFLFLLWEDTTGNGACTLDPVFWNYWAHKPQLLKTVHPRACAPQQKKSLQWEAHPPQWRVALAECK